MILLEVAVNLFTSFEFGNLLLRGQVFGKSPCYRSFERSANWSVGGLYCICGQSLGDLLGEKTGDFVIIFVPLFCNALTSIPFT